MIEVSLEQILLISDSELLWPTQFKGLIASLEDNLDEQTRWKVISDWCQDHEEYSLSKAFDYMANHMEVSIGKINYYGIMKWAIKGLPEFIKIVINTLTLPGCITQLAIALRTIQEGLK